MYYSLLIYIHFILFWIHSSIQDDNLEQRKSNVETAINYCKHQINMRLSSENQTIDEYVMCRSKLYQSVEQRILMGEFIREMEIQEKIHETTVRNSHIMKKCFSEEQSVYENSDPIHFKFYQLDGLIRERHERVRICNIYLLSHNVLQNIHQQIDNQLKRPRLEQRKSNVETAVNYCKQDLNRLIKSFRSNEKNLQDLRNQINMRLSSENQTIDEYVMCRSKLYQSVEQRILMGEFIREMEIQEKIHETTVRNSHIMKKCFSEEQSVYENSDPIHFKFYQLDGLIRERHERVRICNIYLLSHNILQNIHQQIDNQLKQLNT
uniref:t-SNARE coiled-coil homology domain-containing protein n=1 Tax=Schistosoma mansoni TaxID=6183 RepID=A0A5K4F7S0_SCHMA